MNLYLFVRNIVFRSFLIKQKIFHDFIANYCKNILERPETDTSDDDDWAWRLNIKINVCI